MKKREHRWCGVKAGHETIQVGRIPGRKSLALYYDHEKDGIRVLAWFREEADARLAERMLLKIARLELLDLEDAERGDSRWPM